MDVLPSQLDKKRRSASERVEKMDPTDRLALHDFLRAGQLPMVRMLSNLCRAGMLHRTPDNYEATEGVRGAVAEFMAAQRREGV